jgi:hypothetical protein
MTTYVLIHGAADSGWFWHLLESELRHRGHDVVAPDLPCDDDSAGLAGDADTVVDAIGARTDLVVVAQSFGGFPAGPGGRGVAAGPGSVRHPDPGAVAAPGVAGCADEVPAVPRRPPVSRRVHAPGGAGTAGHHPR